MPIEALLTHRVSLVRMVVVLDELGEPELDEDGHIERTESVVREVAVAIQPMRSRERAALHQAGATVSTHKIFAVDRAITTADHLIHDPSSCPVPAATDLPLGRYNLQATPDAAGVGHHLEIEATLVGPSLPQPAAAPVGSGSGS